MPARRVWRGPSGSEVSYQAVRSFGAVWVTAGGPTPSRLDAARAFEDAARDAGARVLWFGLEAPDAVGLDRPRVVIGAEPLWATSRWPQIVADKRSVRAQIYRARNKGVAVGRWDAGRVPRSDLEGVLEDWLGRRGLPPLGFMADPYVLEDDARQIWVADLEGAAVGYLVLVPGDEALVEWIIQSRRAPNGTAALLLDTAVRSLPGESSFTLGLVPLSTFAPPSRTPPGLAVRALLAWVRAHATRFYNFQGLERFKAKFVPDEWRPLWLVTDGRPVSVLTFHAVAAAFAAPRGPTRFVGRAIVDAVLEEVRRLR